MNICFPGTRLVSFSIGPAFDLKDAHLMEFTPVKTYKERLDTDSSNNPIETVYPGVLP
ncbi:hypothetical protein SCBWM1_gp88 [Synechococcus phage S-CBWM1]|uniref:Uncharacterized protein n=1 Tax=Synechococcus phage S-CBWM1 TaxID=2053653 RepID=A0A3G1L3L0_9CAUD|nr:hypothetical protein HOU61_gp109 [Synechococcus phage S-CBWM1]ATW62772.1 hypothetical protein SCBWM1_gp88 [Synechococcus phage S-CBWM1]